MRVLADNATMRVTQRIDYKGEYLLHHKGYNKRGPLGSQQVGKQRRDSNSTSRYLLVLFGLEQLGLVI